MTNMKYIMIIFSLFFALSIEKVEFPPHVWIYWDNENTMPQFYRRCLQNTRRILKDTRWQVNLVTDSNMTSYLSIEEFDLQRYKRNVENMQFLSDLFRYRILQKYGGLYLDVSGYLPENLDWLDNLDQNPDNIYELQEEIECFFFSGIPSLNVLKNNPIDEAIKQIYYQDGFIVAKLHSRLIKEKYQMLIDRVEALIQQNKKVTQYFFSMQTKAIMIKAKQKEIEAGKYSSYKYAYQYYRVASFSISKGMYFFGAYAVLYTLMYKDAETKLTVKGLKDTFNFTCRYYKKENHFENAYYKEYFDQNNVKAEQIDSSEYSSRRQLLSYLPFFQPYQFCLASTYILNDSLIERTLIRGFDTTNLTLYNYHQLPFICQHNTNIHEFLLQFFCFLGFFVYAFLFVLAKIFQRILNKLLKKGQTQKQIQFLAVSSKQTLHHQQLPSQEISSNQKESIGMPQRTQQKKITWMICSSFFFMMMAIVFFVINLYVEFIFKFSVLIWEYVCLALIIVISYLTIKQNIYDQNRNVISQTQKTQIILLKGGLFLLLWIQHFLKRYAFQMIGSSNTFFLNVCLQIYIALSVIYTNILRGATVLEILIILFNCLKLTKQSQKRNTEIQLDRI